MSWYGKVGLRKPDRWAKYAHHRTSPEYTMKLRLLPISAYDLGAYVQW